MRTVPTAKTVPTANRNGEINRNNPITLRSKIWCHAGLRLMRVNMGPSAILGALGLVRVKLELPPSAYYAVYSRPGPSFGAIEGALWSRDDRRARDRSDRFFR
jgi:hypothetical protein